MTQDTSTPVLPVKANVADRGEVPSLAFADADGAKRWAKSLMVTGVGPLYAAINGQLRALSAASFAPRERATIAEVMRDQVAHLHTELARRFAGKPQPAADRELDAADQAIALWHALWEQYSACLKPLLEGDTELQGVKAKLLQRGLYVGKQLVLVHALARRAVPASLWQELHAYYRLTEILDCAVTAVSDDLTPHAVGISCYSTYCHALLLGLADPYAMSIRQIELTDRWLSQWARKVFPYAQQRETEGPVMLIDLDGNSGAALVATAPSEPPRSMRFCYPGKLATSVRGRLKRLAAGASPAELQLGHDPSVESCTALLSHLDAHWYQLPRRSADAQNAWQELVTGGVPAAYFRVGGRTFDRQDPLGRLTFQGAQYLQTLGSVDRLRSLPRRRRTQLAVGALAGNLRMARRSAQARRPRHAIAGSWTSSWWPATTSACAWVTSRGCRWIRKASSRFRSRSGPAPPNRWRFVRCRWPTLKNRRCPR